MFAVVEIEGTQVKVSPSEKVFVPKINSEVGSTIKFDKVILSGDGIKTKIGSPYIKGAYIEAKILRHLKDKKVIVFKKKRRKGYKVLKGHRQEYTEIEVTKLS